MDAGDSINALRAIRMPWASRVHGAATVGRGLSVMYDGRCRQDDAMPGAVSAPAEVEIVAE